jgi:hypothetical protein
MGHNSLRGFKHKNYRVPTGNQAGTLNIGPRMKATYLFSWMNIFIFLFALIRIFIIGQLFHFDPLLNWMSIFKDLLVALLFGSIMTSYCRITTSIVRRIIEKPKRYVIFNIITNGVFLPMLLYVFFKVVVRVTAGFIIEEILLSCILGIFICIASLVSYFLRTGELGNV